MTIELENLIREQRNVSAQIAEIAFYGYPERLEQKLQWLEERKEELDRKIEAVKAS